LTADDTILDLLNHPAFAGFGRLLLPWDDRGYDNSMRLRNVSALLAAAIGSHGVARFAGDDLPKPSAVVMAYTGHSEYSANEPPTFVVVGEQDAIAPPSVMERRVAALRNAGTEVEFHRYSGVGHGFGAGTGTSAEGWIDQAIRFWEKSISSSTAR